MTRFRRLEQLKRLIPGAATVLTLSLAVTLRVERSCSDVPVRTPTEIPAVLYSYPEMLVSIVRQTGFDLASSLSPE
jgi:hypothetical protein